MSIEQAAKMISAEVVGQPEVKFREYEETDGQKRGMVWRFDIGKIGVDCDAFTADDEAQAKRFGFGGTVASIAYQFNKLRDKW